jgi:hypothetical protein
MDQTTVEILKALGYPLSSVVLLVILAYLGRQLFEKLLDSVVKRDLELMKKQNAEALEAVKHDYALVLEDRKADLSHETERLKASISVETETYRIAAQKRFEYLFALWESSESLLKDTDFSNRESIKSSLQKVDGALAKLNRYAVLFSLATATMIRSYLETLAKVLTNSEDNFRANNVSVDRIPTLFEALGKPLGSIFPEISFAATLAAAIVPSITKHLEQLRQASLLKARDQLESALRIEFGVPTSESKTLIRGGT